MLLLNSQKQGFSNAESQMKLGCKSLLTGCELPRKSIELGILNHCKCASSSPVWVTKQMWFPILGLGQKS